MSESPNPNENTNVTAKPGFLINEILLSSTPKASSPPPIVENDISESETAVGNDGKSDSEQSITMNELEQARMLMEFVNAQNLKLDSIPSFPFPPGIPLNQLMMQMQSGHFPPPPPPPQLPFISLAHLQQMMGLQQQLQQQQGLAASPDEHSIASNFLLPPHSDESSTSRATSASHGGDSEMDEERGDDVEHSHDAHGRKKKTRTVFSRNTVLQLEQTFDAKQYLTTSERAALAARLSLTETQIKIWFQNRRNKFKRAGPGEESSPISLRNHSLFDPTASLAAFMNAAAAAGASGAPLDLTMPQSMDPFRNLMALLPTPLTGENSG